MMIYMASDICASLMKITFEVRKQLIQMYSKDTPLGMMMHASRLSLMPLMLRDTLFRSIHIAFFYASTDLEHKPMLMYSIPQITDFMRQRRAFNEANGLPQESAHDLSHLFFDFHHYEIKQSMTFRLTSLIIANAFATFLTNPLDVALSKIAT